MAWALRAWTWLGCGSRKQDRGSQGRLPPSPQWALGAALGDLRSLTGLLARSVLESWVPCCPGPLEQNAKSRLAQEPPPTSLAGHVPGQLAPDLHMAHSPLHCAQGPLTAASPTAPLLCRSSCLLVPKPHGRLALHPPLERKPGEDRSSPASTPGSDLVPDTEGCLTTYVP